MPQAPLPAPAARLVPQNLITPMHAGTSTPMDVLAHQQMVDYIGSLQKGVQIGHELSKLPTEGQEQVLQRAHIQLALEKGKALKQQIDAINKKYDALPATPENLRAKALEQNQAYIIAGEEQLGANQFAQRPTMGADVYGKEGYRYAAALPDSSGSNDGGAGGNQGENQGGLSKTMWGGPTVGSVMGIPTGNGSGQQNNQQQNQPIDPVRERLKNYIFGTSTSDNSQNPQTNLVSNPAGVPNAQFLNVGYNPNQNNLYPNAVFI